MPANVPSTSRTRSGRSNVLLVGLVVVLASLSLLIAVRPTSAAPSCSPVPHAPILIKANRDFTAANGVVSGSGTSSNPYLIANLQLNDLTPGYGLKVDNSRSTITAYFNITCVQSTYSNAPTSGAILVWIVNVHTATTISDVDANSGELPGAVGVLVEQSSAITLDNESFNKIGGDGVQLSASDHITVIESKLKAFGNGLLILNSHDITVGQACNLVADKGCNEFTYDDGRGIFIENSHDILVQGTITSADDTGGILIDGSGSYNIQLVNGIASGNGPICPASGPTGLHVDTIAGISVTNGAHDINVKGYTINANGDGYRGFFDIMNGGNGGWLNPCTLQSTVFRKSTPPGGANLDFNGNCYHFEFNFNPVPTSTC